MSRSSDSDEDVFIDADEETPTSILTSPAWTPPDTWGEDKTLLGEEYHPQVIHPSNKGGGKVLAGKDDNGNLYAGSSVRREFERAAINKEQAIWLGYEGGDKADLKAREIGIPFDRMFDHSYISGRTGSGKTTLLENTLVQIAYGGWGFCFIDPGGDAGESLVQRLPEHRLDDVVWIEPPSGNYDQIPSFNFLEVEKQKEGEETSYESLVSSVVEQLISIIAGDEEMYARMRRVLQTILPAMIKADEPYTLLDVYQFLGDEDLQQKFKEEVDDDVIKTGIERIADDLDAELLEPVEGRFSKWVMRVNARKVVSNKTSSVNIREAVEDGKIIIVNPFAGETSEDVGKIVTSAVIHRVWATARARTQQPREERQPFFLIIDELHNALTNSANLDTMINEARKYKLGLILATQYPAQLSDDRRNAVLSVGQVLALKTPREDDGRELMNGMGDYTHDDLDNIGLYKTFLKVPIGDSDESAPVVCNNFAPYPPLRSTDAAQQVIAESVKRHGIPDEEPNANATIIKEYVGNAGQISVDAGDAGDVNIRNVDVDTILKSIHTVEIREDATKDAQYVGVDAVRDELETRVGELGYVSKIAQTIVEQLPRSLVEVSKRSGSVQLSLTAEGRDRALEQDTGRGGDAGGFNHRHTLLSAHHALTKIGCSVDLPDQDQAHNLPDGIATLPVETNPGVAEVLNSDTATEVGIDDIDSVDGDSDTIDLSQLSAEEIGAVQSAMESYEETLTERLDDINPMLSRVSGGRDIAIEAETTSLSRPGQTLRNLSQATANNNTCLFAVEDGSGNDDESVTSFEGYALNLSDTLTNPPCYKEMAEMDIEGGYKRRLYAGHGNLEYDDKTVLRPADAAHATHWEQYRNTSEAPTPSEVEWGIHESDQFVLENRSGEEIFTLNATDIQNGIENPMKVPAWGGWNKERQEYVVYEPKGEDGDILRGGSHTITTYDSKDEFTDKWATVSAPFVPEVEFGIDGSDDLSDIAPQWRILIIPDDDNTTYEQPYLFSVDGYDEGSLDYALTPLYKSQSDNLSNTGDTGETDAWWNDTDESGGIDADAAGVEGMDTETTEDTQDETGGSEDNGSDVMDMFGDSEESSTSDGDSDGTLEPMSVGTEDSTQDEGDDVFDVFEGDTSDSGGGDDQPHTQTDADVEIGTDDSDDEDTPSTSDQSPPNEEDLDFDDTPFPDEGDDTDDSQETDTPPEDDEFVSIEGLDEDSGSNEDDGDDEDDEYESIF